MKNLVIYADLWIETDIEKDSDELSELQELMSSCGYEWDINTDSERVMLEYSGIFGYYGQIEKMLSEAEELIENISSVIESNYEVREITHY